MNGTREKRPENTKHTFNTIASIIILPAAIWGLIPAFIVNRGHLSQEQLDPVVDLLPAIFVFGLIIAGIMAICFGAVFIVATTFAAG